MRFTIAALTGPGRDVKLGRKRVEDHRGFVTKIWNAARFLEMNGISAPKHFDPAKATTPLARWILDASNRAVADCTAALEAYRFDEYAAASYRFTWGSFCDWFIELGKPVLNGPDGPEKEELKLAAGHVFGTILRLLHPAMPFVTEELWHLFGYGPEGSLIRTAWPEPVAVADAEAAREELDWLVTLVGEVRGARAEMNVPPSVTVPLLLQGASGATLARAGRWIEAIRRMARATEVTPLDGAAPKGVAQVVVGEATVMLPLGDVIDLNAERARIAKARGAAEGEAKKIKAKLGNADFVARAPEEVVEENRERLAAAEAEMARLDAALARIAG
jgi:valyl-tRNA synthetase